MPLAIAKLLSGLQDISSLIAKPATRPVQENLLCESHLPRKYDLHLAASQPHTIAIESFDWLDSVLEQQFEVLDGLAHVPDRPASCVTFKPEAIRDTAANLDSPDDG